VTDPVRWLDGDEALTPDERRALEADVGRSSPSGAKHAVWGALAVKLTAASAAAAASSTAAGGAGVGVTASVTTLSLLKFGGVGLALGVFSSTALFVAERPAPRTETVARDGAARAPAASSASAGVEPARAVPPVLDTPPPATEAPSSVQTAERVLREATPERDVSSVAESEMQRVARARAELRSGNARQALRALRELDLDEPAGLLTQEREALLIEALATSGELEAARRRAAAFFARYPRSPHATAVRRATD
jgi:hypothetical protein